MLIVVERRETFHYYYPMGVHPPGDLTVTNKAMPLASESLDFADNTPVQYTYQLTYYENDTSRVGVDLHFTVGEDALAYSFSTDGDVAHMELNDTTVMLRGPLYGI